MNKLKRPIAVGSGALLGGTAWQIAADWWWLDKYMVRIKGGKKLWETATIPERGNQKWVRLWRLENLKEHRRWIKPETQVELVPPNVES
jgi:hypothetical protein